MYHHILVPLDGSKLAESALPAARYFAGVLGARVTLIHVIEKDAPQTIHGERHLTTAEEARTYLQRVRAMLGPEESPAACHIHTAATGDIVQSIVAHQDELSPDLIIMCTHGRGGLRRMLLGSVAQLTVASGRTPVLLIRPDGQRQFAGFTIGTILAPLDGDPAHEQGLLTAFELARATGARIHLLSVLPTMGTLHGRQATMGKLLPGTTQRILELAEADLRAYLARQADRGQKEGIAVSAEILHGDIKGTIARVADAIDAGLIVLGTHGKAGAEAFWTNSIGAGVQASTRRPLLLVPVGQRT